MWKSSLLPILTIMISTATAGTIYLPVQYEYGGAEKYYYGGSDPAVFARAERVSRIHAMTRLGDESSQPIRTYTDLLPHQPNAAVFGFSANDARNEAYQSVPRYFRMADLQPARVIQPAASPARTNGSGTIEIKPYVRPAVDVSLNRVLILPARAPEQK